MFRRVADFQKAWEQESGSTLKVPAALLRRLARLRRSRRTTARSAAWPGTSRRPLPRDDGAHGPEGGELF